MPVNREPAIYQGFVISQIGQSLGKPVEMQFKEAQNCVLSGTHRWADDETDLPNHVKAEIAERERLQAETDEANRVHNLEQRALRDGAEKQSVEAIIRQRAGTISFAKIEEYVYVARPMPAVIMITNELLDSDEHFEILEADDEDTGAKVSDLEIMVENVTAYYRKLSDIDADTSAWELITADQPQVDIPADWRDRHHASNVAAAKQILRSTDLSLTKDQAEGIIAEWSRPDDQIREDVAVEQPKPGEGPEAGNRDTVGFKDAAGNSIPPEARSREAAKELAEDADNDGA